MKLYFHPLACALATRVSLYEAGAEVQMIEVDPRTKTTSDGRDFKTINPLGLVPVLETDEGATLTENAAILQYVADKYPAAKLAPQASGERVRLWQWLSFIGTEVHRGIFSTLLDPAAPPEAKAYVLARVPSRFAWLEKGLTDREFVFDRFSVADAYLGTVLNWTLVTPIDLKQWPALDAYHKRVHERPSFAKAFAEEMALYKREQRAT